MLCVCFITKKKNDSQYANYKFIKITYFECKNPAIILGWTQKLHKYSSFSHKYDIEIPIQAFHIIIMAIRAHKSLQGAPWLPCLLILLLFITFTCASPPMRPKLGVLGGLNNPKNNVHNPSLTASDSEKDYQTFYFDQPVDHFNYQPVSYTTFRERYIVNFKHWRGAKAKAPIFAYLGEESSIDDDLGLINFMPENCRRFGALELYIEVSINILLIN